MARGDNIFLVGMMGAGKTTIGRALARALGAASSPTPTACWSSAPACPWRTIFEIEGEEGFRRRESAVLAELAAAASAVIATGGGAVPSAGEPRSHARARHRGLPARAPESLWERTRHDTSRPLLATADPRAHARDARSSKREPLYREAAHVVVDTGSAERRDARDARGRAR